MKKITLLGPAYPYRGGIATIMERLCATFVGRGAKCRLLTFTVQYPKILFPGKSQYRESEAPEGIDIVRAVNTVWPPNWIKVGLRIRRERPDALILKYWTPFMAPCFGTIARIARGNKHTKVLVQLDNVIPHERHFVDTVFTRYFINSADGFIYMSEQVHRDLRLFIESKPALYSPHPLFDNLGARISKDEACEKLGLDSRISYMLFFGLIRDYKGLDMLIEAWRLLKTEGRTAGRKLLVAGEFYSGRERYLRQIRQAGLEEEIIVRDSFIPDPDVKLYFSAADCLVLPYYSATQSGVTQIAYNFDTPMIATRVGGLAEIVTDGVSGIVTDVSAESIAGAIGEFYTPHTAEKLRLGVEKEKVRFSWQATADRIEELYRLCLKEETTPNSNPVK